MDQLVDNLEKSNNWKEIMRNSCKTNGLKTAIANEFTLLKLKTLSHKLSKSYQTLKDKVSNVWIENELKTFHWTLLALSALRNIQIIQFDDPEWQTLESIFQYKNRTFLKFQARKLITTKIKNKCWTDQESELLKKIVAKDADPNRQWNDIARTLFEISGEQFFRIGKHCRERWLNYLDPTKQRGQWSPKEDFLLLTRVQRSGKKWSEYAAELNRTEHTVKNRFNSLIIKQKKESDGPKKEEKLIQELRKKIAKEQGIYLDQEIEAVEKHVEGEPESSREIQQQKLQAQAEEQEENDEQEQKEEINNVQRSEEKDEKMVNNLQKKQKVKEQLKEMANSCIKQEEKTEKIPTSENLSENKEEKRNDQERLEGQGSSPTGIMRYIRDQDEDYRNLVINEINQIYSPYWAYSPSNGTPNGFMSSPSPLSNYIIYSFSSFQRFTGQPNFTVPQPPPQQQ